MDKRNSLLKCIVGIVAAELLSVISFSLAELIPQGNLSDMNYNTVTYFAMTVINFIGMTLILAFCKRLDVLKDTPKGSFIKGIKISIVLLSYSIITFAINIISCIQAHSNAVMQPKFIAIYILALFIGAGIGEELLFRGICMSLIRGTAGYKSRKGLIVAMTVSSSLFGLLHLANLLETDDVIGTVGQVIYAIGIGFYLAAIYARTGNLWFNIVLHFMVDIASLVKEIFTSSEVTVSEILGNGQLSVILISVAIGIIFFLMGLFIIRKSKMPELI